MKKFKPKKILKVKVGEYYIDSLQRNGNNNIIKVIKIVKDVALCIHQRRFEGSCDARGMYEACTFCIATDNDFNCCREIRFLKIRVPKIKAALIFSQR